MTDMGEELFADVASMDFLGFDFPGTNYTKMLAEQQAKTGKLCGLECFVRDVDGVKAVWLRHTTLGSSAARWAARGAARRRRRED